MLPTWKSVSRSSRQSDHTKTPDHGKETQTVVVWSCFPFSRSAQNHLASTVKGGRRQGRQRKRWEDNLREWTGLEFAKSPRAVENREKLRKLVAKSSVVPRRPSRLRDRWDDDVLVSLSRSWSQWHWNTTGPVTQWHRDRETRMRLCMCNFSCTYMNTYMCSAPTPPLFAFRKPHVDPRCMIVPHHHDYRCEKITQARK